MLLFAPAKLAIATIWQEARGEGFDGKIAVAEVIRTRMARKIFSDGTIEGTVLAPFQFSGWNPRDPNRILSFRLDDQDAVVVECIRAWDASKDSDLTKGATHYVNLDVVIPVWYDANKVTVKIGHHTFLKLV